MATKASRIEALRNALSALPSGEDDLATQIRSRLEEMNQNTAAGIWKLVGEACQKQAELIRIGERETVLQIQKCMEHIVVAQELLLACKKCPHIDGDNGVAATLGITRAGVYVRFRMIGSSYDAMRAQGTTISTIVAESTILSALVTRTAEILQTLQERDK